MLSSLRTSFGTTKLVVVVARWLSSSNPNTQSPPSLTLSYLVNSCGLSPKSAESVCKKFTIRSPAKPDAVVQFLKSWGFTQTQVVGLIEFRPKLLHSDPHMTLKPKFEFLEGIGVSRSDLARTVTLYPRVLGLSVKNQLAVAAESLKSLALNGKDLIDVLKGNPWLLEVCKSKIVAANIEILLINGVPMSNVSKVFMRSTRMLRTEPSRFTEVVAEVKGMGIDPLNYVFIVAIFAKIVKNKWERNLEVFKSVGLSDAQIMSAFKVQPWIFVMSEEKIRKMMKFIVGRMGFAPTVISKYPNVLLFSLEHRIMPRYSVLEMLMKLGLIQKDWNLYAVLHMNEKDFLAKYVVIYQEKFPELMKLYQAKGDR